VPDFPVDPVGELQAVELAEVPEEVGEVAEAELAPPEEAVAVGVAEGRGDLLGLDGPLLSLLEAKGEIGPGEGVEGVGEVEADGQPFPSRDGLEVGLPAAVLGRVCEDLLEPIRDFLSLDRVGGGAVP